MKNNNATTLTLVRFYFATNGATTKDLTSTQGEIAFLTKTGNTLLPARGVWLDSKGKMVTEDSYILEIIFDESTKDVAYHITVIVTYLRKAYNQEEVLVACLPIASVGISRNTAS